MNTRVEMDNVCDIYVSGMDILGNRNYTIEFAEGEAHVTIELSTEQFVALHNAMIVAKDTL